MSLRVAELETLFTADITDVETKAKTVKKTTEDLAKKDPKVKIDADAKPAIEGLEKVEAAAHKLVSQDTIARVDANIAEAETKVDSLRGDLAYLDGLSATMDVDAEIAKAKSELGTAEALLNDLKGARAVMDVDADTSAAKAALGEAEGAAGEAGDDAGDAFGKNIIAALGTIPIAGAVVGIGVAAGKALLDGFQDGLQVEVRQDRLQALTGITEAEANRFGRDASEAYSQGFGESIESNMDTARLALQGGLLDVNATRRDSQNVIASLAGIADVLGEEVQPVSNAVATMLRTGIVKSADEAFDVLATGAREGVNANEDLLDTFIEYPALLARLGLSAEEGLGLMNQGLTAGARNTDLVADALKEFQIRATDASEASAEGFKAVGLDAEEMTAKIAAGGPSAKEGLDQVLDGLRAMEDPVARNAAGVALFGTQWEDMGDAMLALDLTTAVDQLNGVDGAAKTMFDTIASNDASNIEVAKRNIEVAAEGMKGALAAAFSEPLGEAADWISMNRGPMMQFLLDVGNGAIEMGLATVEGAAAAVEAFGDFGGAVGPIIGNILDAIANLMVAYDEITPGDQGSAEFRAWADGAIVNLNSIDENADGLADTMRENVGGALVEARDRLNQFGQPIVNDAYVHDMMVRNADAVALVGLNADGTVLSLEGLDTANLSASSTGQTLQAQLVSSAAALADELAAAQAAGEGQDALVGRYNSTRAALIQQVSQMGIAEDQATDLVDAVLRTPDGVATSYTSNSAEEQAKVIKLSDQIVQLPDGSFTITAYGLSGALSSAETLNRTLNTIDGKTSTAYVTVRQQGQAAVHDGALMEFYASGGLRAAGTGQGLTPMSAVAQLVNPNTWRVVGDRGDVPEAYIPLDGSARSLAILMETLRRWPGGPPQLMAGGGITPGPSSPAAPLAAVIDYERLGRVAARAAVAAAEPVARGLAAGRDRSSGFTRTTRGDTW